MAGRKAQKLNSRSGRRNLHILCTGPCWGALIPEPTSAWNSPLEGSEGVEIVKFILTWLGGLYDHQGRPPLARPMHCTRHGAELVEISNGDSRKHHFYPEGSAFAPPLFFLQVNSNVACRPRSLRPLIYGQSSRTCAPHHGHAPV